MSVKKYNAYTKYLITGLADYATSEEVEKAKKIKELLKTKGYSSLTALRVRQFVIMGTSSFAFHLLD